MISAIVTRLLASLLIAESMFGALRVAGLVSQLQGHDAIAVALIVARGLLCALQFVGGWLLANRRPQGFALAPWAFVTAALLTLAALGFLPPVLAAAAQSLPDVAVFLNSSRLLRR